MRSPDRRKRYEKPSVTRVGLHVEHSVLQGCHSDLPNRTGYLYDTCWTTGECLKQMA